MFQIAAPRGVRFTVHSTMKVTIVLRVFVLIISQHALNKFLRKGTDIGTKYEAVFQDSYYNYCGYTASISSSISAVSTLARTILRF